MLILLKLIIIFSWYQLVLDLHRPPAGANKKATKLAESYTRVPKSTRSAHKARPSYWLGNGGVGIAFA